MACEGRNEQPFILCALILMGAASRCRGRHRSCQAKKSLFRGNFGQFADPPKMDLARRENKLAPGFLQPRPPGGLLERARVQDTRGAYAVRAAGKKGLGKTLEGDQAHAHTWGGESKHTAQYSQGGRVAQPGTPKNAPWVSGCQPGTLPGRVWGCLGVLKIL